MATPVKAPRDPVIEGRTPVSGGVNAHIEKPFKVSERYSLRVAADLFNITNARPVVLYDQFNGITGSAAPNPDFLKVQHWDVNGPARIHRVSEAFLCPVLGSLGVLVARGLRREGFGPPFF